MNRRELLRNISGVGLSGLWAGLVKAAEQCSFVPASGQICSCGIPPEKLAMIYGAQDCPMWCWAASAAMIFRYYGMEITQEEIVAAAYGQLACAGANEQLMLMSLNRVWTCRNGNFRVTGDIFSVNPSTAIQDLRDENPLYIGVARQHVVVLTGATYVQTNFGPSIQQAIVRDPAPNSGGRRALSPQEWYAITFSARVRVDAL